jgi:hypothetical protein
MTEHLDESAIAEAVAGVDIPETCAEMPGDDSLE